MPFRFNPFTQKQDIVDIIAIPPGTVTALDGDAGGAVGPDASGDIFVVGGTEIATSGNPGTNTLTINYDGNPVDTVTGNSGGAVSPNAGALTFVGSGDISIAGDPGTNTLTVSSSAVPSPSPFIVGPTGNFATIQDAIDAASAGDTIFIQSKTAAYAENLTMKAGVHLYGIINTNDDFGVIIQGSHVVPASGSQTYSNISWDSTGSDIFTSVDVGSPIFQLFDCSFDGAAPFVFNMPSFTAEILMSRCRTNDSANGVFTLGATAVTLYNCDLGNNTASDSIGAATFISISSRYNSSCTFTNTTLRCFESTFHTLTSAGTTSGRFLNCSFDSGSSTCFDHGSSGAIIFSNISFNTSNASVIAGAGVGALNLCSCSFLDGFGIAGTLTLATTSEQFNGGSLLANAIGVGTGTTVPINKLDVSGGAAIGSSFAAVSSPPTNGIIVEGNSIIGDSVVFNASERLTVTNETDANAITGRTFNSTGSAGGIGYTRARGTLASPTAVQSGDVLMALLARGLDDVGSFGANVATIRFLANQNFTSTARGTRIDFATTSDGATSRTTRARISNGGNWFLGSDTNAVNRLDVSGAAVIGSALAGVTTAPTNGLLVTGGTGIGVTSVNASALLEVGSTTQGVRFPNMTTAQRDAISSPAAGLVIYTTTSNSLSFYNGTSWGLMQVADSGTYTPTMVNISNTVPASSTINLHHYLRVGNEVTVTGDIQAALTGSVSTAAFRISLPVTSNFTSSSDCRGTGTVTDSGSATNRSSLFIIGDTTNDNCQITVSGMDSATSSALIVNFEFKYTVK